LANIPCHNKLCETTAKVVEKCPNIFGQMNDSFSLLDSM